VLECEGEGVTTAAELLKVPKFTQQFQDVLEPDKNTREAGAVQGEGARDYGRVTFGLTVKPQEDKAFNFHFNNPDSPAACARTCSRTWTSPASPPPRS